MHKIKTQLGRYDPPWKRFRIIAGLLFVLGCAILFPNTVEASLRTIPSSAEPAAWNSIYGATAGTLITDYDKMTVKSTPNSSIRTYTLKGDVKHVLTVSVDADEGEISNVAAFRFSNAGSVFGNNIDIVMNVTRVSYSKAKNCSTCPNSAKKRLVVMALDNPMHLGQRQTGVDKIQDSYYCQHRRYNVDLSFSVYYAGTNTLVPSSTPFYQTFYDMDAVSDYGREAVFGYGGFTGDVYVFSRHKMSLRANPGDIMLQSIDSNTNRGGRAMNNHDTYAIASAAANGSTHSGCSPENTDSGHDWDSTINGGGVASIRGNTFSERYTCHSCSSALWIYSPTSIQGNPSKSVNSTKGYYDGDACDWNITQPLGTYYSNMWQPYSSLVFTDTMDPNLTVTGVDVYKSSVAAANRLSTGNYSYSLSGQRVTVSMASGYLNNTGIYDGKPLILVIHTKVKANGLNKAAIPNTGTVTMEGTAKNTNTVSIRPLYRVYVTHEGQGTTNPTAMKDGIEWNASSKVTYAPAKDWYTKEIYYGSQKGYTDSGKGGLTHKGGSDLKTNSLLTEYTFTGINEDKHLHAVFIPIPELTIQKVISGDRKDYSPFGSPLFHYKIQGTDYLGDTHTWYWNIQKEGSVTRKVPAGDYTVTEMPVSRYTLKAVDNVKNFANLSVNDRKGSCNLKNGLPTDTPGNSAGDGHIKFTNQLSDWKDYGHNSQTENKIK